MTLEERPSLLAIETDAAAIETYRKLLAPQTGPLVFRRARGLGASVDATVRERYRLLVARTPAEAIELVTGELAHERSVWAFFVDLTGRSGRESTELIASLFAQSPRSSFVITGATDAVLAELRPLFAHASSQLDVLRKPLALEELRQKAASITDAWRIRQRCDGMEAELREKKQTLAELTKVRTRELERTSTTMREIQDELFRSEARLRAIIASASDGIVISRRGGAVIDANPAAEEMLGLDHQALQARALADLFLEADGTTSFEQTIQLCLTSGRVPLAGGRVECLARAASGATFPVEIGLTTFRTLEDVYVAVFFANVTEKRQAAERMTAMSRDLLDMARRAGMAEVAVGILHNLGNVLNGINVSATVARSRLEGLKVEGLARAADVIAREAAAPGVSPGSKLPQLGQYLKLIGKDLGGERDAVLAEIAELTKKVDHVKSIVTVQQSYAVAHGVVDELALSETIEDAIKLSAATLARDSVVIERSWSDAPTVVIDRHKLVQVLVNLIANAKDAMRDLPPERRKITVRVHPAGDGRVQIEVADEGCGIDPESAAKIFSLGFTTKRNGHGFGLHFSALAVREMGGALTALSAGRGKGATFVVDLPLAPAKAREGAALEAARV